MTFIFTITVCIFFKFQNVTVLSGLLKPSPTVYTTLRASSREAGGGGGGQRARIFLPPPTPPKKKLARRLAVHVAVIVFEQRVLFQTKNGHVRLSSDL